jgi:hypothetical protein
MKAGIGNVAQCTELSFIDNPLVAFSARLPVPLLHVPLKMLIKRIKSSAEFHIVDDAGSVCGR